MMMTDQTGEPWVPLDLETHVNFSRDTLERNIRLSVSREFPFLLDRKWPKQTAPLAIVGGGPSLHHTIGELRDFHHVMVVSSAHDYLIAQGIRPDYAVFCDAMPNPIWFKNKIDDCLYLIATQCDPSVMEMLTGCDVRLWDTDGGVDESVFEGRGRINGGSSAALRAPALGMVLGFSDFHFFGIDSCFEQDKFAYPDDTDRSEVFTVKINDREFRTTLQLVAQVQDFQKLLKNYGTLFSVTVHGDSFFREAWQDMRRKTDDLINRARAA